MYNKFKNEPICILSKIENILDEFNINYKYNENDSKYELKIKRETMYHLLSYVINGVPLINMTNNGFCFQMYYKWYHNLYLNGSPIHKIPFEIDYMED